MHSCFFVLENQFLHQVMANDFMYRGSKFDFGFKQLIEYLSGPRKVADGRSYKDIRDCGFVQQETDFTNQAPIMQSDNLSSLYLD